MAKTPYPLDIMVYINWLDAIENEASDELTDWESGFVENIGRRLRSGQLPSPRQAEILERIYAEKTS